MPSSVRSACLGGQRLYSAFDVRRLILIKQLVDLGHAIGVVAALSPGSLSSMHAAALERDLLGGRTEPGVPAKATGQTTSEPASREQAPVRTALVGAMLVADNLQQLIDDARLCLVAHCPDASTASSALSQIKAELLITEIAQPGQLGGGHPLALGRHHPLWRRSALDGQGAALNPARIRTCSPESSPAWVASSTSTTWVALYNTASA